jgi:hypothetical protein
LSTFDRREGPIDSDLECRASSDGDFDKGAEQRPAAAQDRRFRVARSEI